MDTGRLVRARNAWSGERAALRQEARENGGYGVYDTHREAASAMRVSIRTMHSWLKGCSPLRYAPTNTRYPPRTRERALSLWREGLRHKMYRKKTICFSPNSFLLDPAGKKKDFDMQKSNYVTHG